MLAQIFYIVAIVCITVMTISSIITDSKLNKQRKKLDLLIEEEEKLMKSEKKKGKK